MKYIKKIILSIVLGISIFLVACGDSSKTKSKTAIENVLHLDALCSEKNNNVRINKMKNIDLSKCPSDFSREYKKHIRAWEDFNEDGYGWSLLGGFLSGILSFSDAGASAAAGVALDEAEAQELIAEIQNTYKKCLIVAEKYNVNTSIYRH